jgi:hypothetical protein
MSVLEECIANRPLATSFRGRNLIIGINWRDV